MQAFCTLRIGVSFCSSRRPKRREQYVLVLSTRKGTGLLQLLQPLAFSTFLLNSWSILCGALQRNDYRLSCTVTDIQI